MQSNDNDECWLTSLEQEYIDTIESEEDYEHGYHTERDSSVRNIWSSFQESATSIAQLYRDRLSTTETGALWLPFQTAAGTVTNLYRESAEGVRRVGESAVQCGYQKRNRELADWARNKRRRYIRRDDLLSYLAGKPPPPLHSNNHHHHHNNTNHHHNHHHHNNHYSSNNHHHTSNTSNSLHHHLQRQLIRSSPKPQEHHHVQNNNSGSGGNNNGGTGGNGGVSGISSSDEMGIISGELELDQPLHTFKKALAHRSRGPELYAFVSSEIARNCKRPASPLDVNMEIPNISKRHRFV